MAEQDAQSPAERAPAAAAVPAPRARVAAAPSSGRLGSAMRASFGTSPGGSGRKKPPLRVRRARRLVVLAALALGTLIAAIAAGGLLHRRQHRRRYRPDLLHPSPSPDRHANGRRTCSPREARPGRAPGVGAGLRAGAGEPARRVECTGRREPLAEPYESPTPLRRRRRVRGGRVRG